MEQVRGQVLHLDKAALMLEIGFWCFLVQKENLKERERQRERESESRRGVAFRAAAVEQSSPSFFTSNCSHKTSLVDNNEAVYRSAKDVVGMIAGVILTACASDQLWDRIRHPRRPQTRTGTWQRR